MAEVVRIDASSDEDEEDNSNDLTSEECEKRCQAFAEITGTDTALAMFYLQDREWIVERSLNDYFASQGAENSSLKSSASSVASACSTVIEPTGSTSTVSADEPPATYLTTAPPVLQKRKEGQLRILSWNIDGIDPDNLHSRTEGVCSVLKQENPEVIFLQEVVHRSMAIVKARLAHLYHVYPAYGEESTVLPVGAYFTAILVRKDCVHQDGDINVRLADFPTSKMSRNLLQVECNLWSVPVTLMTSHLESTAECSEERKRQLKIAFDHMKKQQQHQQGIMVNRTVIFGGDLNLRDKELQGISAKPPGIYDLWECTGKRPEAKFTWDLTKNDNKQLHGKFQPRCRFDRMYVSHPADKVRLKPVYFELVGIQRLSSCRRFPSDHWGILAHLNVLE